MDQLSYRVLPLFLSLLLLLFMGIIKPEGARVLAVNAASTATLPEQTIDDLSAEALVAENQTSSANPHLYISKPVSFGEMELRVISDCSIGHCVPKHSITWGTGVSLELDSINEPIERIVVCDLDQDGDLELALTTTSCGSGRYGTFLLLEWSRNTWTPYQLCSVPDSENEGGMGHERITVWNDHVEVTFPLYAEGDPNCCPTAGYRSLSYVFKNGNFSFIGSLEGPRAMRMSR
jgi:hypothetical protein